MTEIYALTDPREPELIRYVGSSIQMDTRYSDHIKYSKGDKGDWIKSLIDDGIFPTLIILEHCDDEVRWDREAHWSKKYREEGHPLLNRLDGRSPTEETRKRIGEAGKGKHSMSDEHRAIIKNALTGRKRTTEECAAISAGKKGKKQSAEHRANNAASKLGKKASNETKEKMSASHKNRIRKRVTCPHCNKEGDEALMTRYHFDKCKSKPL